jgi:hypothetical protein
MDQSTKHYTNYTASKSLTGLSALVVNNSIFNWQFGDPDPRNKSLGRSAPETSIFPRGSITYP